MRIVDIATITSEVIARADSIWGVPDGKIDSNGKVHILPSDVIEYISTRAVYHFHYESDDGAEREGTASIPVRAAIVFSPRYLLVSYASDYRNEAPRFHLYDLAFEKVKRNID